MFNISFSELVLIAVVALVVIGPERLPKVARTFGLLVGRAQRYVHEVKTEIDRELNFEEIEKIKKEAEENMRKLENTLQTKSFDVEGKFKEVAATALEELNPIKRPVQPEPGEKIAAEEDPRQLKIDFDARK